MSVFSLFPPDCLGSAFARRALGSLLAFVLTLQKVEEIEKVMDRDFYMTAQEAIDFGVVDKILTKRPREGVGSGSG